MVIGVFILMSLIFDTGASLLGTISVGLGFFVVGLLIAAASGLILMPQGLAITADAVRVESGSVFRRRAVIDIRREFWIELWQERVAEEKGAVHLFTCSPDRWPTTYAIPLFTGSWQDAKEIASRVGDLLRLPPLRVLVTPPQAPLKQLADFWAAFAEYKNRLKQQMDDAARLAAAGQDDAAAALKVDLRQARRIAPVLLVTFNAVIRPEAWLLNEHEVTHQDIRGTRTNYAIHDIAAVEAEPEVVAAASGGEDTTYEYVYAVCLLMNSGESFRVRPYKSYEDKKTDRSEAYLNARWTARYLRKVLGLPKP
jgi:hypothetical protein